MSFSFSHGDMNLKLLAKNGFFFSIEMQHICEVVTLYACMRGCDLLFKFCDNAHANNKSKSDCFP